MGLRGRIERKFGNLLTALKLLQIEPNTPVYTKEILIDSLRDFYVLNRRLPREHEWGKGRLAWQHTYIKHFGSTSEAYRAAGLALVANNRNADVPRRMGELSKQYWSTLSPEERSTKMRVAAKKWPAGIPEQRSRSMKEWWSRISPEEHAALTQKFSDAQKKYWSRFSPEERAARMQSLSAERSRKAREKRLSRETAAAVSA